MTDIVAFLHARLNEDEQIAQSAAPGPWTVTKLYSDVFSVTDSTGHDVANESSNGLLETGNAQHMARQHPPRTLAEVAAKRRIIDYCRNAIEVGEIHPNTTWNDDAAGAVIGAHVLALMTLPYQDHADFDSAWTR